MFLFDAILIVEAERWLESTHSHLRSTVTKLRNFIDLSCKFFLFVVVSVRSHLASSKSPINMTLVQEGQAVRRQY